MKTNEIIILGAVALGAYMLLSRQQSAGSAARVQPGTYRPLYPNTTTPAASQRAQLDAQTNGTLYGLGNFLGGLFGTRTTSAAPPTQTRAINNDDLPGQPGYGWKYYSDGTSIAPDGSYYSGGNMVWAPDSVAVNPPGGYEQPPVFDYTNDEMVYWN